MRNAQPVLDRAFEPGVVFSAADIAVITPLANAVAEPQVADAKFIRQSLGGLAASLPSQATDIIHGNLKLGTYKAMFEGCDPRALAYAVRRCLDELDWMPTVHQIKERMAIWISPEEAAIRRARFILRTGKRDEPEQDIPITAAQIRAMKPEFRSMGLAAGHLTKDEIDAALSEPVEQAQAA